MLKNYLTIAFRTLWKQRGFAAINVGGLAVGLAFCALIALYVQHEWTYDRHHERGDRIVRLYRAIFAPDGSVDATDPYLPMPLAPALVDDLPAVEAAVRLSESRLYVRPAGQETAAEQRVVFADPALFAVFTVPLVRGDAATALADPQSVVLTPARAAALFGDADAVGQTVQLRLGDTFRDFTVTAVAEHPPSNATLQFELLAPFAAWQQHGPAWARDDAGNWESSAYLTYALLHEGAPPPTPDDLLAFRQAYYPDETARWAEERGWTADFAPVTYRMQPLHDLHLDPSVQGGITPPSDPFYAKLLAAIALGVLGLACINFMTLAVGRAAKRAKEVGVRKAVGARRGQLAAQFWGEALLMTAAALGLGLGLAQAFLPTFNRLTEKTLSLADMAPLVALVLVGVALAAGLVAGSYPALLLASFRPTETLRGRLKVGGASRLTRALVVVQFALSVFLIGSTLVMLQQLDYVRTMQLGFDEEHLVVIPTRGVDGDRVLGRFRAALAGRSDVAGVTGANTSFARGYARRGFTYEGELFQIHYFEVEADYPEVMGMNLVAGRGFDPARGADSTQAVLVNEAAVRAFGWQDDAVGKPLAGYTEDPAADPRVVGVLEDYHFQSAEAEIHPLLLTLDRRMGLGQVLVRVVPENVPATLAHLEATWRSVAGDVPFAYSFLDDDLDGQYADQARWGEIIRAAAFFAVLIACLGLFGLAALAVAGRTKEVGIRKVLGATAARVTVLLSKDFAALVLVGAALALPAAWLAMRAWLGTFAYRIDLGLAPFLAALALALGIALATVSLHTIRAATADPVKALRYE